MAREGIFSTWQPRYAGRGIATFPVKDKRPCVRHWQKVGLKVSSQFATKFADADAFGFQCGARSCITVIDIDSHEEGVLKEAVKLFGESPIIWRTGSGNYAMPFRYNGEERRIRAVAGLPIDVLGRGFAVAPPSLGAKSPYEFLKGSLAEFEHLPIARFNQVEAPKARSDAQSRIFEGKRNEILFRLALEQAPHVDNFDTLVDVLRTRNMDCDPFLSDAAVIDVARSAWRYQEEGRNLVGRGHAIVLSNADYQRLRKEGGDDAALLYCDLRCQHWGRNFVMAKAMACAMGWGLSKWRKARATLERLGFIRCIHRGGNGPHDPPIYTWS